MITTQQQITIARCWQLTCKFPTWWSPYILCRFNRSSFKGITWAKLCRHKWLDPCMHKFVHASKFGQYIGLHVAYRHTFFPRNLNRYLTTYNNFAGRCRLSHYMDQSQREMAERRTSDSRRLTTCSEDVPTRTRKLSQQSQQTRRTSQARQL